MYRDMYLTHIHTQTCTQTRPYIIYTDMYTHTDVHIHHRYTQTHTHTDTMMHMYIIHTDVHTHTQTYHRHTHTDTHTDAHIHPT